MDVLKSLAIVAVVLYFVGWCMSGYFGVEAFLVHNGYLYLNLHISYS